MKQIPLTQNKVALVDDDDFEIVNQFKWCFHQGYADRFTHYDDNKKQHHISLHRFIMNAPVHLQVDHLDGNGLNNQKRNLRLATHQQNAFNSEVQKNSGTGYKGVTWRPSNNTFQCRIRKDNKRIHIGIFKTKEEAALAYNQAAIKYHGEFARLNNVIFKKFLAL